MFKNKWVASSVVAALTLSAVPAWSAQAQEVTPIASNTASAVSYTAALNDASAFTYAMAKTPTTDLGSSVLTLAKANFPVAKNYYDTYYQAVEAEAKNDFASFSAVSKYATTVLAVTAIGKDATNVGGVNLIEKMVAYAQQQKAKGDVDTAFELLEMDYYWLLTALDANDYAVPKANEADFSREAIVDFLVTKAYSDGGFSWGSSSEWATGADVDSTAMAITALAPYKTQPAVDKVITKGLAFMQSQLSDQAGFYSEWAKGDSPESVSQLIIAQLALGINPQQHEQFVLANGAWTVSNLLTSYDKAQHAFKNSAQGTVNQISNVQAAQALTAYAQQTPYYDLSAVDATKFNYDTTAPVAAKISAVSDKSTMLKGTAEKYATVTVKSSKKVLATTLADGTGRYDLAIAKQKAGTKLVVTVTDAAGNTSKVKTVTVADKTAPAVAKVNTVKAGTKYVTGKAEKGATVIVQVNGKKYRTKASTTGKFSVKIPKQQTKKALLVMVKDTAGNKSKTLKVRVK